MTSMIIADDELVIRQGLMTIPWKEYGIEVVGVASNGEEAFRMSAAANPQILLTDIKMPGMDGLKFIEMIKKEHPEVKAILLTGYQDFQYAHSAIQLGAVGYVLKPSDPDEIVAVVLKAKNQIEDDIRERAEKLQMLQRVNTARTAVLHTFLQDLAFGRVQEPDRIVRECGELGYSLDSFVVMLLELRINAGEIAPEVLAGIREELFLALCSNYKGTILDIHPVSFCIINKLSGAGDGAKENMLVLAMDMENAVKSKYGIAVSIGISKSCRGVTELHKAFNQARNCLGLGPASGKGNIIHVEDLKDGPPGNKIIRDILHYIEKFYMNEISLITVSEYVHMNHIYISRLIKKETGETFLDILTRIRMEKACELLANNDYKSYEISYMVGIKDAGYFSQVFKKYYKRTPSEYRESILEKNRKEDEKMP